MEKAYQTINEKTGGVFHILVETVKSFSEVRGARAAASMAYYAIFSLFPLLIVLIALGGLFMSEEQATERIQSILQNVIPVSENLIEQNIENVMEQSATVGAIGLIGLLWSASGVFNVLIVSINLAWKQADDISFLKQRLFALGLILLMLVALLVLPLLVSFLNLLPSLAGQFFRGTIVEKPAWFVFSNLLPFLLISLTMWGMYKWVPKKEVKWKEALWGAVFAGIGLVIVNRGFTFYITSGLSRYQLIYGSLGAVVALLTWMYLSSLILILGAHLSAAVAGEDRYIKDNRQGDY